MSPIPNDPGRLPPRRGDALPTTPTDYHQLLRGPRRRWWRPLWSLILVLVCSLIAMMTLLGLSELSLGGGERPPVPGLGDVDDDDDLSPASTLSLNLILAMLIPVAGLATWVAHRIRPGFVSSVTGRLRWRWLARCVLVVTPVWVVYLVIGFALAPPESGRPAHWVLLLVMALVLTPFQAAGEEYLFRGWLTQNVSVFFSRPAVGLVVSTTLTAALFSLAHGSFDPWVLVNIAALGVAASYANWRTGGLEAGIAMHLVNNVLLGIATTTIGGYADSFVSETTTGRPAEAVASVLVHTVAVLLILWQGRRSSVQRRYQPPAALGATERPAVPPAPVPAAATWYVPLGQPPVA